jgi:galactoside O-acetyltransferase
MIDTLSFLSYKEISKLDFNYVGENVKISRFANFYGSNFISIGSNSRIDDFCILSASSSGQILIGKHVHIAAGVYLFGSAGIEMGDFSSLSSGVKVYSASDDYSGDFLTNPTVASEFLNVIREKVFLGKHSLIGSGTVVMPGVKIEEGSAVGALSFVNKSLQSWGVYAGQPVKFIKNRSTKLLKLEIEFLKLNQTESTI